MRETVGVPTDEREEADAVTPETPDILLRRSARTFTRTVDDLPEGDEAAPLPGGGRTDHRFALLADAAREDLGAARLLEGHLDALAILAELDAEPARRGQYWGVWAAQPPGPGLTAVRHGSQWLLSGLKRYCSGARSCTHALVTAATEDGDRLFAVRTGVLGPGQGPRESRGYRPVPGTWPAIGMAGSDSLDVRFDNLPGAPVGEPGAYVDRPGFHHGGVGVAACWLGGAHAVARVLRERAARRSDALTDAHTGAVDVRLYAAGTALTQAAHEIDADPLDATRTAEVRALRIRALVADTCSAVLDHVGRATGAGPLSHHPRHARAAADLTVYVRQHHAERDLAALGALIAGNGAGR
ncbi:acyl-CoA dehydrogenase [Streptomyces lonarensis]|uniref:Acyl-CoA dehydrogenase n=1 Tax=Streptomyces lonarensis TaxID=700599 RepID=A0A7X6CZU8_9ACTN|nr:acyl-CoA dehydrogenase [Streptomyces lonarensis]NJQ05597.1 acyl-CoA dehydrogenase [Streptomyces lonarensis]